MASIHLRWTAWFPCSALNPSPEFRLVKSPESRLQEMPPVGLRSWGHGQWPSSVNVLQSYRLNRTLPALTCLPSGVVSSLKREAVSCSHLCTPESSMIWDTRLAPLWPVKQWPARHRGDGDMAQRLVLERLDRSTRNGDTHEVAQGLFLNQYFSSGYSEQEWSAFPGTH